MLLVQKKIQNFAFLCFSGFGFINFYSQKSKFPMMLVNMFWIAEGFGYMRCRFNFGFSTFFVRYIAFSNKKEFKWTKVKNGLLALEPNFCRKMFGNFSLSHFTTAELLLLWWIWYLGLQQSIEEKKLLNYLSRDFKYLKLVELVFPLVKLKTFWIFNMFACSYSITLYLWPAQSLGLNLNI